ncbi:AAA family ATPase [Alteromonas sp. 14N.309.X.WAT.G.H12]|uniref:SF1B family DNA helicase RecD2 n=1 Tax=Alteromonas sp. 14N.309.X.WAT.G.H12 TaxID=3120824 RepID=UPI002FD0142C
MNRSGVVKKVKWLNEKNDFAVIEMLDTQTGKRFIAVGKMGPQYAGHKLNMVGKEVPNPRGGGMNFEVHHYEVMPPDTAEGIYLFLASGIFKGITKRIARYLVDTYKEQTLTLLNHDINILTMVPGVGVKTFIKIRESYQDALPQQEKMTILQNRYRFTFTESLSIIKQAPENALLILERAPYSLYRKISNKVNFVLFDRAILGQGWSPLDPVRIREVIMHQMKSGSNDGHTLNSYQSVLKNALGYLNIDKYLVENEINYMIERRRIYVTETQRGPLLQSQWFYAAEKEIANRLSLLIEMPAEKELSFDASDERLLKLKSHQRRAVVAPFKHKVSIITGRPGAGKTTLLRTILDLIEDQNLNVLAISPTGKASQRLREVTGRECSTIHRALGATHQSDEFLFNDINPLSVDVVLVDEMSMLDTLIFRSLLRAIPQAARLIMIGDVEQLPSVQAGAVFRDLIDSNTLPVYWLTEVLRIKKEDGTLPTPLHISNGIREGKFYDVPNDDEWSYYPTRNDDESRERLTGLIGELKSQGLSFQDVQVFSPTNKGSLGVAELNGIVKSCFKPHGQNHIEENDKIMQTVNDYDMDVYNGDVGIVRSVYDEDERVSKDDPVMLADMTGRLVEYTKKDLYNLTLAYAISGHKSQGSEYPHVIIMIPEHHFSLMDRYWLYTLVTRCQVKAHMIGNDRVIKKIVKSRRSHQRNTLLKEQIWRFIPLDTHKSAAQA